MATSEQQAAERVASKLTGEFYVGQIVMFTSPDGSRVTLCTVLELPRPADSLSYPGFMRVHLHDSKHDGLLQPGAWTPV
jgi:hypothetical protein